MSTGIIPNPKAVEPPVSPIQAPELPEEVTRPPRWTNIIWSSHKARFGIFLLGAFVLIAVFAPLISPYPPARADFDPLLGVSSEHLLGTTTQGNDILSQLIHGTRVSLLVGLFGGFFATLIAMLVGMISGYTEGTIVDDILSFFTNVAIVVPVLPLMIVLVAYSEVRGIPLLVFVIAITSWAGHARAKRSQIITLRNRDFVTAAKFAGEGMGRIVFREIMPNMTSLVAAGFVGAATGAIGAESGLSFLGLGDPNSISWGTMLFQADAQGAVAQGLWIWLLAPGLTLAALITSLTFVNFGRPAEQPAPEGGLTRGDVGGYRPERAVRAQDPPPAERRRWHLDQHRRRGVRRAHRRVRQRQDHPGYGAAAAPGEAGSDHGRFYRL